MIDARIATLNTPDAPCTPGFSFRGAESSMRLPPCHVGCACGHHIRGDQLMNRTVMVSLAMAIALPSLACMHEVAAPAATAESNGWAATGVPPPPPSQRSDFKETIHGVEFVDSYRWLEDQNSPDTRAWIEAQNGYARSLLENRPSVKPIRDRLT